MRKQALVAVLFLAGCGLTWLAPRLGGWLGPDTPTPDEARAALVGCLDRNPPMFLSPADRERYASLPLEPDGGGVYRLGAIRVDPGQRSFDAHVGSRSWHAEYRGVFERVEGRWVARVEAHSIGCGK